jgi:hypothetical protein
MSWQTDEALWFACARPEPPRGWASLRAIVIGAIIGAIIACGL